MAKREAEAVPKAEGSGSRWNSDRRPAKKQKTNDQDLIKSLNALPVTDLQEQYFDPGWFDYIPQPPSITQEAPARESGQRSYAVTLKPASDLHATELTACFNLLASTSKPDYENSTFGWHPKRKQREMREPEMRYLLVRSRKPLTTATAPAVPPSNHEKGPSDKEPIEAFISFMATHDSDPSVPVLYIYEIHLLPHLRKIGLGAHLMWIVETVAKRMGVQKVMLTCFLSNEKALSFYKRRGYVEDISSPGPRKTRAKVVEPDYVIMSRDVPAANAQEQKR